MANITNPTGAAKTLDFNTFERLAKDSKVDNKATVHLATQTGGRVVVGLEAKTPIAGKKINLLGKPISDLSKATEAQRNGILATQAFKQALIQRYGETIANAVDKHLLQSGKAKILTAEDLRKNLKVADAIVRILRETPTTPKETVDAQPRHNHELSNSSSRRNDDGSPREPSAPARSRSASANSESSVDTFFKNREQPPAYRSTEDLRPSAPSRSRTNSHTDNDEIFDHLAPKSSEEEFDHLEPKLNIDEQDIQWSKENPLYVKPNTALEIAGEAAHLLDDEGNQIAEQRPRSQQARVEDLEIGLQKYEDLKKQGKSGKS